MTDGFCGSPQGNVKVQLPTVWAIQFTKKLICPFLILRHISSAGLHVSVPPPLAISRYVK